VVFHAPLIDWMSLYGSLHTAEGTLLPENTRDTTSMREKFDWSIRATVASLRGRGAPLELQKSVIAWSFLARSRSDGYAPMINSAPPSRTLARIGRCIQIPQPGAI
jgi:hypothetical protein